jgi:protein-tyrosine phosphatase
LTLIAGDTRCQDDDWNERWQQLVNAEGRRIELAGLFNLRDLGGYPTAQGTLPWRMLLRSDALHQLDAEGTAALADLGLRTVVDLRTHVEVEIAPSPLDQLNARHAHVSILGSDLEGLPPELDAVYAYVVTECGTAIADAIRPLCAERAFPALVHCTAGKDRTGIVIAMVLAVLGVPDQVIAADYALSASYLDRRTTAAIGQLRVSTGLGEDLHEGLILSPPQLIMNVLRTARDTHGSAGGYLVAHGLSEADLDALRATLAG